MSGDIAFINGEAQMAYLESDGLPWHGLGRPLKDDLPLEDWVVNAGLDWEAIPSPMFTTNAEGELVQVNDRQILIHSKTDLALGFPTQKYKIVQPRDVANAFQDIAAGMDYKIVTMGNLNSGKRIWALAYCGEEFSLGGKDIIRRNILISTSYDGTMATIVEPTTVRVVCANTLALAAGADGENAKIRISHNSDFDPKSIRADLLATEADSDIAWNRFKERALALSKRKVSHKEAVDFFVKMFGNADENGEVDVENRNTQRTLAQVMELYSNGRGQETLSAQDTAWGLVNTVTRWTDHERNSRSSGNRLNSALFGDGVDRKNKAMSEALTLVA